MRARKPQIGDLVSIKQEAEVLKFHKHPMDIMSYLNDIRNEKFIYRDGENVRPEAEQNYLISDTRDLFNKHGYRTRCCKIVGIIDSTEGWIPGDSLDMVAEGSEETP